MIEALIYDIAIGKTELDRVKKWLIGSHQEISTDPNAPYITHCSRAEFVTHFINFIHEDIFRYRRHDSHRRDILKTKDEERNVSVHQYSELSNSPSSPYAVNQSLEKSFDEVLTNDMVSSTPKRHRVHSQYSSSTYNNNVTNERFSPMNLGDFIVSKKSLSKKRGHRGRGESCRRITPTSLSQLSINNSFQKSNSFNDFNVSEIEPENSVNSRNVLVKECLSILSKKDSSENCNLPYKAIEICAQEALQIQPDINYVSHKKELNNIAELYTIILKHNFVLNITSEIFFLIFLLLWNNDRTNIKNKSDTESHNLTYYNEMEYDTDTTPENLHSISDVFKSIHNIVYFAAKCLESQISILRYFDKSTLKLLTFNRRLKNFAPKLADRLRTIADQKSERTIEILNGNAKANVCFNFETDNRTYFPSDNAFHAFKKQRDMFYEILSIWEQNHLHPNWSFSDRLDGRIKALFGIHKEPLNIMHFARLFKAHLISTCGRSQNEPGLYVDQTDFISSLPNIDSEKLERLKNRLVTKQSSSGLNMVPQFTGYQEFYKYFILTAENHAFNTYLTNILISEILEMSNNKFIVTDLENAGTDVDPSTRKIYMSHIICLRLLAKFLGYITSLPYKSEYNHYKDTLLETQIRLRQQIKPLFDIKELLLHSMEEGNLVITIPWLTVYLSMFDYVGLRLPYYVSVHQLLFKIYQSSPIQHTVNYNNCLIKFSLGWLFELPHFPDQEYFSFCNNGALVEETKRRKSTLDRTDLVDQTFLYICCPYLEEVKKLLTSNIEKRGVTIKHITPTTSVDSTKEIAKKQLELHLEEAFYNGQPASVKKTIEFVSERVSSTCIKHICYSVVPNFKAEAIENLRGLVDDCSKNSDRETGLKININTLAEKDAKCLKEKCNDIVSGILETKIIQSIESLLAVDSPEQMRKVCISLAVKMTKERVKQWLMTHITGSIFIKDYENEVQKISNSDHKNLKAVFALPPTGREKGHNDACFSAFHLLEQIKLLLTDVLQTSSENITRDDIFNLVKATSCTLEERCDVNGVITTFICTTLVDLSLILLTHRNDIMLDEELTLQFIKVWQHYNSKMEDLFKNVLCPRNIMLIIQSDDEKLSWASFSQFLVFLIKQEVISTEMFESQCTAFFRQEWDQETLQSLSFFIKKFIELYNHNGNKINKLTLLLEFLAEYCTDI